MQRRIILFWCVMMVFALSSRKHAAYSLSSSSSSTANKLMDRMRMTRGVIRRNESVIFFPTCGYRSKDDDDAWVVPIHGWIFDDERRGLRRRAFLALLRSALHRNSKNEISSEQEKEEDDDEAQILQAAIVDDSKASEASASATKEILARRVLPFIVDNHRRRKITIRFGNTNLERTLPEKSRKNGHFHATNLKFTEAEIADAATKVASSSTTNEDDTTIISIQYQAVTGIEDDTRLFQGTSQLIENHKDGISVISDIDDTVKISHVLDKKLLLRHTFLEEFKAVPGMASLYQSWKRQYNASFHYVSSSPWQLYEEIASFLTQEGFPAASSFHLKSIRLKDRTLLNLFADPMESKLAKICSIMDTYPQ